MLFKIIYYTTAVYINIFLNIINSSAIGTKVNYEVPKIFYAAIN